MENNKKKPITYNCSSLTEILKTEREWARELLIQDRLDEMREEADRLHVSKGLAVCPTCKSLVQNSKRNNVIYFVHGVFYFGTKKRLTCADCFDKTYREEAISSLNIEDRQNVG